jgi:RNA polymerase sigma-70 factor (ECF subfamily)
MESLRAPVEQNSVRKLSDGRLRQQLSTSLGTLRQLAHKLTRSTADADDLLQATCLRALESAARLRDHSNLAGWLARVMRNLQIDQSRSRATRVVPLTERQVAACAPEGIAIWRQVDDDEVEQLLPGLSPQLRVVWHLHHVEGLDQNAIATKLGIPRTTVATRMFRARLALRTVLLKRYGDGDLDASTAARPPEPAALAPAVPKRDQPRSRSRRRRLSRPRLRVHQGGMESTPAPASTRVDTKAPLPPPAPPTAASAL